MGEAGSSTIEATEGRPRARRVSTRIYAQERAFALAFDDPEEDFQATLRFHEERQAQAAGASVDGERLVRLRADPAKLRVSIRREKLAGWVASVSRCSGGFLYAARSSTDPVMAVVKALQVAAAKSPPGLDLDLSRTYPHPFP